MIKLFQKIYWLTFIVVLFAGIMGCQHDNSTAPETRNVLRTGETTGGRKFDVIQETYSTGEEVFTIHIEGEEDVVIEEMYPGSSTQIVLDSIYVYEYPGTPNLVYIAWQDSFVSLDSTTSYHYLVFPKGKATTILLRGQRASIYTGHYLFHWIQGEYQLEYQESTLEIVEHWKECIENSGACQVKETQLSRNYQVSTATATLLACEERSRTADYGHTCLEEPQNLAPLPGAWQITNMSPDDITKKCAALDPSN